MVIGFGLSEPMGESGQSAGNRAGSQCTRRPACLPKDPLPRWRVGVLVFWELTWEFVIALLLFVESVCGWGWARGLSACWWGDGLPRRRRVAGLRGRPATLGLRHGPDSYGRQQWGILHNGRKPDAATPREG